MPELCTNIIINANELLAKAQTVKEPLQIVTLDEALNASKGKSNAKKTWVFKADNVRDFAWTASRRFVWDAMPAMVEGKK